MFPLTYVIKIIQCFHRVDVQLLMSNLNTTQQQLLNTQIQLNTTQSQLNTAQTQLNTAQTQLSTAQSQLQTAQLDLINTKIDLDSCKGVNSTHKLTQAQLLALASQSQLFESSTLVHNNRVYLTSVPTSLNLTAYQESCWKMGGKLAEIRTQDQYDAINTYVRNQSLIDFVFVGMTDAGHEGDWTYMSDNSTLTFVKWVPGEPKGGSAQNCGCVYTVNMMMYDCECFISSYLRRFLCEVSL